MHIHSLIVPAIVAGNALLTGGAPAMASGNWSVIAEIRHYFHAPAPVLSHLNQRHSWQAPFPAIDMLPRLFPQADPNSGMGLQSYRQLDADRAEAWRERQWGEHHWLESQRQQWTGSEHLDWRDWGQYDRNDRSSREREGRARDWRGRQGNSEARSVQETRPGAGADADRNAPKWGYRDSRR